MKIYRAAASVLALWLILLGSQPSQAQFFDDQRSLLDDYDSVPVVGQVISAVQDAVEELITEALDRFDATLLRAAMEARVTVNQVTIRFDDVLEHTVDELDDQQRRIISDLYSLADRITQASDSTIDNIMTPIRQDLRLLLSRDPGYIRLIPGYAVESDDYIEFALEGTALSQARMADFRIGTTQTEPPIETMDDSRIVVRIPLNDRPVADMLAAVSSDDFPLELPISFALEECSWFGWFCREGRRFRLVGYVLPENVGTVRAVFVGDITTTLREKVTRGPFVSARVKASWLGKSGRRDDVWAARPDDGWKIDVESARLNVRLVFGGCSGRRCSTSWIQQDEQMLRVRTRTETDRSPTVTCKTETTITFNQWRSATEQQTYQTKAVDMQLGTTMALPLESESALANARLAHLVVESDLVRGGTKILRVGQSVGGLRADYDPATQIAYLNVAYRN